jgi:hypothetical protein
MRLHKWLVRGLVFSALISMAGAVLLYQRWTDPTIVRQQVIAALQWQFPGADVSLEAARLRLLGGILLTELHLLRHDDLSRTDITYIPSAIIYHDKQQLLDGVLALRKVELHRPRLRLIRESDGRWNVEGLARPGDSTAPLPTVVIHEGTILLEDRRAEPPLPPLEISGVQATMINDPVPTIRFEGTGVSNQLGRIQLKGVWQRETGTMTLSLQVADTQINPALVQRLAPFLPPGQLDGLELKGLADFQLELAGRLAELSSLDYDLACQLRQGFCRHPRLPLPLDQLAVKAHCHNGRLTIENATARSADTKVSAQGVMSLPDWDQTLEASLTVDNLYVNDELNSRLPDEMKALYNQFRPAGRLALQFDLEKTNGRWLQKKCVLKPQQMEVRFADFPYPVPGVTGTLDADLLTSSVKVNLASAVLPVTLTGLWQGIGPDALVDLYLRANQVPLDEKLLQALPNSVRDLARSFHARGWGDVQARITHAPGTRDFCNTYQARFYDTAMCWDQFRYPLENVSGNLDIFPDHVEFQNFRGQHHGGIVNVSGKTIPWVYGKQKNLTRLMLEISGQNIGIDTDLRQALNGVPNLAKAWDTMVPSGRLGFQARIDQVPDLPQDLEIGVTVKGCKVEPAFFRYPLSDVSGKFRFRHNRLEVTDVEAKHQDSRLAIGKATVDLAPEGGYYANLENVRGSPIYPDDGLIEALPPSLQRVFTALNLKDPIHVQTQLIIAQSEEPGGRPDVYWNGKGRLADASLQAGVTLEHVTGEVGCVGRFDGQRLHGVNASVFFSRATVFRQSLEKLHGNLIIKKETPDVLALNLEVPAFGGDISGEARLDLNSTLRYEMNLTASQLDLHELGRHNLQNRADLKGKASARLHLTGQGTSLNTLAGDGTFQVAPGAKLYNLPFLLDLLKFLGLRWPDSTAFEEAFASYSIHGNRLSINRMELWGSAVSLTGQGDVNLDGTDVKLDFYPSWARVDQLLPSGLKDIPPWFSKNLLKIEVRGKISDKANDLKFHKRLLPAVVEPLMQIHDHIAGVQHDTAKPDDAMVDRK